MGDKSKKDAMLEYVNMLTSIDPEWEEKVVNMDAVDSFCQYLKTVCVHVCVCLCRQLYACTYCLRTSVDICLVVREQRLFFIS